MRTSDDEKESGKNRIWVILFTDIVQSVAIQNRLGTDSYQKLLEEHDALFRKVLDLVDGGEIMTVPGDGLLVRFPSVTQAVNGALAFQWLITHHEWKTEEITVRMGIHEGEIVDTSSHHIGEDRSVGMAINVAARVMDLACGRQILMTRGVFDDARQYVQKHPAPEVEIEPPALRWAAHGRYLFAGLDEPMEIFEVGGEGIGRFVPPSGNPKARRSVAADEEETLGWRPGAGLDIPRRKGWVIVEKLGRGGFGEVWLGKNQQTNNKRVFKFCYDPERLRSFKRELTLFRLIRDALGERPDIAKLCEVQMESSPFFLESEYCEAGNLMQWASQKGGLSEVPLKTRIEIVAKTAKALAAAHSVGIIHKDIKPSNIFIFEDAEGRPTPRLADFGIGVLHDRKRLDELGITAAGLTDSIHSRGGHSPTGTHLYASPEYFAGSPPTVKGDIYAMGVLLYQMAVSDLTQPVGSGWERDIQDPILAQDLGLCVDRDPDRRLGSADELARRLFAMEERGIARKRGRRRRAILVSGGLGALIVTIALALGLFYQLDTTRREASGRKQVQRALSSKAFRVASSLSVGGREREAIAQLCQAVENNSENRAASSMLLSMLMYEAIPLPLYLKASPMGEEIIDIAISADDERVVARSDGAFWAWSLKTGREIGRPLILTGAEGQSFYRETTRNIADELQAVLQQGRSIRFLDLKAGEELMPAAMSPNNLVGLAVSRERRWGVTWTGAEGLNVVDLVNGDNIHGPFPEPNEVLKVIVGPQFRWLAEEYLKGSEDLGGFGVRIRDLESGQLFEVSNASEGVSRMACSADGRRIVFAEGAGRLSGIDMDPLREFQYDLNLASFYPISLSHNYRWLTAHDEDGAVHLWDLLSGADMTPKVGRKGYNIAAISLKSGNLITVSPGGDAWVWATRIDHHSEPGDPTGREGSLAVNANARCVARALPDYSVQVVSLETGEEVTRTKPHEGPVTGVEFSPGGEWLATVSESNVQTWDATTGDRVGPSLNHNASVSRIAILFKGAIVVTTSGVEVNVWNVTEGKRLRTITLRSPVWTFALSRSGSHFAVGLLDNTVEVFETASGRVCADISPDRIEKVDAVAIAHDGKSFLTVIGGRVQAWILDGGQRSFPAIDTERELVSIEIAPDGRRVMGVASDGTLRIWDLHTGVQISPDLHGVSPEGILSIGDKGNLVATSSGMWVFPSWEIEIMPWFLELARAIVGLVVTDDDEYDSISPSEYLRLKNDVIGMEGGDDLVTIAKWIVSGGRRGDLELSSSSSLRD